MHFINQLLCGVADQNPGNATAGDGADNNNVGFYIGSDFGDHGVWFTFHDVQVVCVDVVFTSQRFTSGLVLLGDVVLNVIRCGDFRHHGKGHRDLWVGIHQMQIGFEVVGQMLGIGQDVVIDQLMAFVCGRGIHRCQQAIVLPRGGAFYQ